MVAGGIAAGASSRISVAALSEPCSLLAARAASYEFCLKADAGYQRVQLTWTPPASGKKLAIYEGTTRNIREAVWVGTATGTSATVAGLKNDTMYYFWLVTGRTSNVVSNMASATPARIPAGIPGRPAGLTAAPGDAQVTLSWAATASDGHSPVTGYNVYEGTTADFTARDPVTTVTGTVATVTGLVNGTTYYFRVTAFNKAREGPPSCEVPAVPVTVPGAPAGLTATPGNTQVTLSWAAPASDGGSAVTGYNVYEGTTAEFNRGAPLANVTGTVATVTGLVNGTTYYFQVTAVNGVGEGQASEVPAVPVTAPGAPARLTATPGDSQVTLSWDVPASNGGSAISGYVIYQGTSPGGKSGTPVNGLPVTATSYKVTSLTNGTTYYFRVIAVNAAGPGPPSDEASAVPVTVPGPPTWLTVTPGNAQVTLSWAAPASDGGSSVTGYNLYAGTTADLTGSAPVGKVTGTVVTVTGLANGTTYYFRLTAINRVGEGPASALAKAVAVTVPGAPAGLAVRPGKSQMTLSWAAPASNGGSAISGYVIYQGTSPGGGTGTPVNGLLITATSYTVTGLANGTTYHFRVAAVNAVGQGPPSEEVSATLPPPTTTPSETPARPGTSTPSETPANPGIASPFSAPTGLTATGGNTQVRLSWTAPAPDGGSPVISYKVYFATTPGVRGSAALGTTKGADAIVAGLANGTTYYFMVTAVNAAGNESPFSTQVPATPAELTSKVTISLTSSTPPKQLIAFLAAVAAAAAAGAFTLIARRRRRIRSRERARSARSGQQTAVASDVRAVPDTSRPDVVGVRDTGREPTHTVRLEPHPGLAITTIKEGRP